MGLKEIELERVDWIYLAQDRDQWWALVNEGMKLGILAVSLAAEQQSVSCHFL
jgi:hypothetical protein